MTEKPSRDTLIEMRDFAKKAYEEAAAIANRKVGSETAKQQAKKIALLAITAYSSADSALSLD
jgi:hypothetical protein